MLKYIRDVVCNFYNISANEIMQKTAKRNIVFPRQVAMYFSLRYTNYKDKQVGLFYNRDRATVYYANNIVKDMIRFNKKIKHEIDIMDRIISGNNPEYSEADVCEFHGCFN